MKLMVGYTAARGFEPMPGKPTFTAAQEYIGGWIEQVKMPGGIFAWCDEDGRHKDLPRSIVVRHRDGYAVVLAGPVVFEVPRAASPEDAIARVLLHAQPIPSATQEPSTVIGPPPSTPR